MNDSIAKQAGSALIWKGVQLAGTKGIFLVRTLILARLLLPSDFGLLAIATIAVDVLLIVTDFGMIPALVQRTQPDDRHFHVAWTVGMIRAMAIAGFIIVAAPFIAELFAEPRATNLIRVLALRPLIDSMASIKLAELTRNLQFKSLAFIKLPDVLVNTVISIALASAFGVWALVVGILAGAVMSLIMSYFLAPYRPHFSLDRAAAHSLIRFGRWIFVRGLVMVAGNTMLQLVIARQLGISGVGLYFLAGKLAFLPYEVASEVVGTVAFPLYARLQTNIQQASRAFRAILIGMATILVPTYALIIVLAPSLVQTILGERWIGTAPVIQVLAVVGVAGLFGDAVGPLLQGFGQPDKAVVLKVVQTLLLVLLAWWLTSRYGVVGAALAWLPAIATSQLFSAVFLKGILSHPFAGLRAPMSAIVLAAGVGAAVALGLDSVLSGIGGFVVATLLAVAATGLILWALDRRLELRLAEDFPQAFPHVTALVGLLSYLRVNKTKSHSG